MTRLLWGVLFFTHMYAMEHVGYGSMTNDFTVVVQSASYKEELICCSKTICNDFKERTCNCCHELKEGTCNACWRAEVPGTQYCPRGAITKKCCWGLVGMATAFLGFTLFCLHELKEHGIPDDDG